MDGSHQLNRRNAERVETDIALTCRVPATPVSGRILDLSELGCRIALASIAPDPGVTISIDVAGHRLTGEVMWCNGREIGIRFHRRLAPELAVHWGIAEPETLVAEVAVVPGEDRGVGEIISHWFRRLGSVFR